MIENQNLRSVNDVIDAAKRWAPMDSPEEMRGPIIEIFKDIYRALKLQSGFGMPMITQYQVRGREVQLPVETLSIIDVAMGRISLRESVGADGRMKQITPMPRFLAKDRIIRFERPIDAIITVTSWQIPVDENGEVVIHDELFLAAVYAVAAQEALIASRYNNMMIATHDRLSRMSGLAIDSARATVMTASWNEMLDVFASVRRNFYTEYDA